MSSSTMIQGAAIRRASMYRKAVDATTSPASQTHTGTARTTASELVQGPRAAAVLSAKTGLPESLPELGRLGRIRADPDLRCSLRHLGEHPFANDRASGGLLERSCVEIRDTIEPVRPFGEGARCFAHRPPQTLVRGELHEGPGETVDLRLFRRDFHSNV